jgi:hypothetical protein
MRGEEMPPRFIRNFQTRRQILKWGERLQVLREQAKLFFQYIPGCQCFLHLGIKGMLFPWTKGEMPSPTGFDPALRWWLW